MENRAYAILAGLFTLVFITLLVAAVLWFGGDTRAYNNYLLVSRYAVNGLYPEAYVRFRGINVGKVDALNVDSRDPRNILISIRVEKRIPITKGAYGQLGYQGVTGIAYVMLDDDGSNPEPLATSSTGPAQIPVRGNMLDELSTTGQLLLANANALIERLNKLASDDNAERLSRTLANLEAASAQLEPSLRSIPQVTARAERLLSEKSARRIERTLENVEQATAALAPVAEDTRAVLANMQSLSKRIDRMADELSTEVTNSTLPRVDVLVDQLAHDARDLRRVLLQLEREPRSLIFGRSPGAPGPGEPGFSGERK